jgi:tetratricopeptide (TPR) repeat protein
VSGVAEESQQDLVRRIGNDPDDTNLLDKLDAFASESQDYSYLRAAYETIVRRRGGPAARMLATRLSKQLAAAGEEAKRPRDGMEFCLRAAQLFSEAEGRNDAASEMLGAAWRLAPDHRIVEKTWSMLGQPTASDMPDFLLIARSQLGGDGALKATLQLADRRLEQGRLGEAERLYRELQKVKPHDRSLAQALEKIAEFKKGRNAKVKSAESAVKRAGKSGPAAVKAWTSFGVSLMEIGESVEAEDALRTACAAGDASEAEQGLERLLREQGRLEELARFLRKQMERAATYKKQARESRLVELRRRLYRLLKDELKRPQEAKNVMNFTRAAESSDASATIKEARRVGRTGNWKRACKSLETAADRASSGDARLAMMLEIARIHDIELKDEAGAEEVYKTIRTTDPDSIEMLQFFRRVYRRRKAKKRAYNNLKHLHQVLIGANNRKERVAVAVEMARLARNALSDKDYAIEAWKRVLRDESNHKEAHRELRRLYKDGHRWHAEVELLNQKMDMMPADSLDEKINILFEIIDIYQDSERLGMEDMVVATYNRVVELSPSNQRALDNLARKYRDTGKWNELLSVLRQRVDHTNDPEELLSLFGEIARLYMERVESDPQAIPVLERMLELDPGNLDIIQRLRAAFTRKHSTWRLYETYQKELELLEGTDRVQVLVELARIATEDVFKFNEAVKWWRKLLDVSPGDQRAIAALERLHAEQEDWPGYITLLEKKLEGAYTRKQRIEILLELGEVAYSRLGDEEKARRIFLRICDLSPFNTRARRYLQRIYITRRAWPKLIELYQPRDDWEGYLKLLDEFSEESNDSDLVADIQVERSRVQAEFLNDDHAVIHSLERALTANPDRLDVAQALLTRYQDSAPVERQLSAHTAVANLSQNAEEKEASWRKLAALRTEPAGLYQAWSETLLVSSKRGNIEGIDEFERSMLEMGDWSLTAETLSTVLANIPKASSPARIRVHRSLGQIAREQLKDPERAITHYKCVLFEEPGDEDSLEALEELYLSQHNFMGLEEVLKKRSEEAADPSVRRRAMGRLGQLYEDVFGHMDRAADVYRSMIRELPDDTDTVNKLRRAYGSLENWPELADALEQVLAAATEHRRIVALRMELAELYRTHLDELRTAAEHYRAALEVPGVNRDHVVRALEDLLGYPQVESHIIPILERSYRAADKPMALLTLLQRKVDRTTKPEDQLPIYDEIAFLAQHAAADLQTAFEAQQARFRLDATNRSTWNELEQLAQQLESWDVLAALWREGLSGGGISQPRAFKPLSKRADRNALRLALVRILGENQGDIEERIDLYESVLRESRESSEYPDIHDKLENLYRIKEDWPSVVDILLRAGRIAVSDTVRRDKMFEAADLYSENLDSPEKAIEVYQEVLKDRGWDSTCGHLLANLFEVTGRYDELASLIEEASEQAPTEEERDALRLRLSDILNTGLKRQSDAVAILVDLLSSDYVVEEAVEHLIALASQKNVKATLRNGVIEELTHHFDTTGNAARKAEIHLMRLTSSRSAQKRSQLLVEAGVILAEDWSEGAPAPVGAERAYELFGQALEENDTNDEASAWLRRAAAWTRKLENCANRLARAAEGNKDSRIQARRWLDLAALASNELDDPALAIEAWNRVIDLDNVDSTDVEAAFDGLIEAYGALGADENRLRVLRRKRDFVDSTLEKFRLSVQEAEILHALGESRAMLDILARCLPLAEVTDEPEWREARDQFAEEAAFVANEQEDGSEGIALLRTLAAMEAKGVPLQALRRYNQASTLAENRFPDTALAVALLEDARLIEPTDPDTVANLDRILEATKQYPKKVSLLRDLADLALAAKQEERALALLVEMGDTQRTRLEDTLSSLETYKEALEMRPDYPPALDAVRDCIRSDDEAATGRFMLADAYKRSGDDSKRIDILQEILDSDDLKVDEAVSQVYLDLATTRLSQGEEPHNVWRYAEAAYRTNPVGESGIERRALLLRLSKAMDNLTELAHILFEAGGELAHREQRLTRRRMDVAYLRENDLDKAEIVSFWKSILVDDPDDDETLSNLETVARDSGNTDELVIVLGAKAASAKKLGDRIGWLRELASLLIEMGQETEAAGTLERIVQEDPGQQDAFNQLTELYQSLDMPEDLVEALESQILHTKEKTRKRYLQKWLARTWWLDLDDLDRAVSVYGELLGTRRKDVDPEIVEALEGIWDSGPASEGSFDLLEPIYIASGSHRELAHLYRSAASREGDTGFRCVCLEKLYHVYLNSLGDAEAAFGALLRLIEADEPNPARLDRAETMAEELSRWPELLSFYGRLIELGWGDVAFITRVGSLWDEKAGDTSQAIHSYELALQQDSLDSLTRDRLTEILTRQERWAELAEHLGRSAEAYLDRADKIRALLEQATLYDERLNSTEGTLRSLRLVLQLDPAHLGANERLAALLGTLNRTQDLHSHYRNWTDRIPTSDLSRKVQTRLALSLLNDQHTMVEGLSELGTVLDADADLPEAHEALVSIIERAERTENNLGRMPEEWAEALERSVELLEKVTGENPTSTQQEAIWRVQLRKLKGDKKRRKLLEKLGRLLIEQNKPDAALVCFGEMARANPKDRKLRKVLSTLSEAGVDGIQLVSLYEDCLQADLSESLRVGYTRDLASHLLERMHRPDEACGWYEQLIEMDPSDRRALEALASTYRETASYSSEERILTQLIDLAKNRKETLNFSIRLGDVRLDHLGKTKDALLAFEDCLPEGLLEASFRSKLERLYGQRRDFSGLTEIYAMTLEQDVHDDVKLEMLAKSAQVLETQLEDLDGAAERCRRILSIQSDHRFALKSLARIERSRENWAELFCVLKSLEEVADEEREIAGLMASRATLAAQYLGRSEDAIDLLDKLADMVPELARDEAAMATLRSALKDSTTRVRAAQRLEPLLAEAEDWEGLLEALNVILETKTDIAQEVQAAIRMAQVAEVKIRDPLRAVRIAGDVLVEHSKTEDALLIERYLDGVGERHGCWNILCGIGERVCSAVSGSHKEAHALEWLATLQTRSKTDPSLIASTFEQLVALDEDNEEWLNRLEELYRQAGRWDSLRELIAKKLGQVEGEERVAVLLEMAQAYDDEGDTSACITMMADVLHYVPRHTLAVNRLERGLLAQDTAAQAAAALEPLARADKDWDKVIQLLEMQVDALTDARPRVALIKEIADLYETELGNQTRAFECLARALDFDEEKLQILGHMEVLASKRDLYPEMAEVLIHVGRGTQNEDLRVEFLLRLAELRETRLGDAEGARAAIKEVQELAPDHPHALRSMIRLARGTDDLDELETCTKGLLEVATDIEERVALLAELYEIARRRNDHENMLLACRQILEEHPGETKAVERLLALYRVTGDLEAVESLLQEQIRVANAPVERAKLSFWLGQHFLERGYTDQALNSFEASWRLDSNSFDTAQALAGCYRDGKQWRRLHSVLSRKIQLFEAEADSLSALLEIGQLAKDYLDDVSEATSAFERALEIDPNNLAALDALLELCLEQRRARRFIELSRHRATLEEDIDARNTRLMRAAKIALSEPDLEVHVGSLVAAVLADDPYHPQASVLDAERKLASGEDAHEAALRLEKALPNSLGDERISVLLTLSEIYSQHLDDAHGALPFVLEARELDSRHPRLADLLRSVFEKTSSFEDLKNILENEFEHATTPAEQCERALELAKMCWKELGDDEGFKDWIRKAREIRRDSVEAAEMLVEFYMERDGFQEALPTLEWLVNYYDAKKVTRDLPVLAHKLAKLLEETGEDEKALDYYRMSLHADGTYIPNLLDYGKLLSRRERWVRSLRVHQSLLMQRHKLENAADREAVLLNLSRASYEMGETTRARQYLARLLDEVPDHQEGKRLLSKLRS